MSLGRKNHYNYFEKMSSLCMVSNEAAKQLDELLENYTDVESKAESIHDTEHKADEILHDIFHQLNISFITPIDREDIIDIINTVDDVTDAIEDVANQLVMLSIDTIHPDAIKMSKLILRSTDVLYLAMQEFEKYKVSKKLKDFIIDVNKIETEGDHLFRTVVKNLFLNHSDDPIYIMRWKEIFETLENVLDSCEDAANVIDSMAIKNS